MPYACSAGDDAPVVVHLQQLDGDYEQVDFCSEHWVQFIAGSAQALGLYDPGDVDGTPGPVEEPDPGVAEGDDGQHDEGPVTPVGDDTGQPVGPDGQPVPDDQPPY